MIAFVLGLLIGYLISWFFRKKQGAEPVSPTEDTAATYTAPDRESGFEAPAPAAASTFPAATAVAGGAVGGAAALSAEDDASASDEEDAAEAAKGEAAIAGEDTADEAASPEAEAVAHEPVADEPAAEAAAETPADEEPAAAAADGSTDGQVTQPAMTMIAAPSAVAPAADAAPAAEAEPEAPAEAPYGPGSAVPLADGAAPSEEYTVKGNADSGLYHTTESPYYKRTKAEVWFKTAQDADAAGFLPWDHRKNGGAAAPQAAADVATEAAPEAAPESPAPVAAEAPESPAPVAAEEPVAAEPETPAASVQPAAATSGAIGGGVILGGAAAEAAPADADSDADTGQIPVQPAAVAAPPAPAAPAETTPEPVTETTPEPVAETAPEPSSTPFGPGSALPMDGGEAPSGEYTVKGNADSMLFHTTESPYYPRTVAEVWFKTADDAEAAGFTAWNARRKQQRVVAEPTWEPGVYPGSAKPTDDGSAPAPAFTVKGNEDSMLYHTIESPYYTRTVAEVWFKNSTQAEEAGFTAWNQRR